MKLNFKISEFCIIEHPLSQSVADKILKYHILPLQRIRNALSKPINISKKSGYRPQEYEIGKGRSGNSQHCFKEEGAVDLVYYAELLTKLMIDSTYKRVCYYPNNGFIHCDYKGDKREYYECSSPAGKWKFTKYL